MYIVVDETGDKLILRAGDADDKEIYRIAEELYSNADISGDVVIYQEVFRWPRVTTTGCS